MTAVAANASLPSASLISPQTLMSIRNLELRARAAQILMRFPGDDPAAELREVRIEHPDRQLGMLTFAGGSAAPALRQFAGFLTDEFALLEARIQHENQVTQRRG